MKWGKLGGGHYGAAEDGGGWVYVISRDDGGWVLRELPVTVDAKVATRQRFATLGAAQAEAEERADMAGLLVGKYGLTRMEVAEVLAQARRYPLRPVEVGAAGSRHVDGHGLSVRIGRDNGGYTVEALDRPRVGPHGYYRADGDRTPRCPSCREPLIFAYCRRCGWHNGIDVPTAFGTAEAAPAVTP